MKVGWEVKTLGESCFIARGGSPRPIQEFLTDDADGVNWIKISDATASDKYIFKTKQKIKPSGISRSRLVNEGDFLLSNSMSFGRPYIMKTTGCIHDGWLVLSEYDKYFDQGFLYHLLSSPVVFEQFDKLAAGSTVRNLNIELASRVVLPIPPLPEQQRIVAILDAAFASIATVKANTEQNLKNARALFDSYLNEVFDNENWETKTIQEVCDEIFAGGDAPKDNFSLEKNEKYQIPIYANAVKKNGLYGYTDFSRVTKPSITISARGSGTGHTEIRFESFLPIVRLIVLIPNLSLINLEFLKHSIDNLEILRSGSAIPQLTVPMIKEYSLPLPSLSEQQTIVQKLKVLREETQRLETLYQRKLTALDELKKALLHQAFNGEL